MSRERDIRNAMYSLIEATGEFDYLPIGRGTTAWAPAAAATKSLSIEPFTGRHVPKWDEAAFDGLENDVRLKVTITAADDDPQLRDELAERLYNLACNALNNQALPGGGDITTMPMFTGFETYRWLPPVHPNRQIEAIFVFRYLLPDSQSYDTSE